MTIFSTISSIGNASTSSKSKIFSMTNSSGVQSLNNISCGGCGGDIVYTGPSGHSYTLPELIAIGVAHTTAFLMGTGVGKGKNCGC
ncbi:hypothetical protein RB653_004417 [Dictyostelium firmibasis]|uniref:Uncharacterized protein n=1 Tax=Dictyostelium firmibasis TaxID=79012 RepID=A0AAN7YSC5_9MYCE